MIEKISVVCGDSGRIGRDRRSCADRTGSHKRSSLVDAGTYIGHPRTWVGKREAVEVVGNRKGGQDVPCPVPRRGRSRQADAFGTRRRVGHGQGGERTYWKLDKNVSGENMRSDIDGRHDTDRT